MIRIATIGTSMITEKFAEAVAATAGITVSVAYSRDAERAAEFARGIGAPASASDLDALLRRDDVDAVYVGTPNAAHAVPVRAALRAGVHVFVEKPAVPTADEFDELVADADAAGRVLFEGMRNVYDPGFTRIRELVPQLGVIRRASFVYGKRSSRYDLVLAGERVNIFDPAFAGGALLDLGVYPIAAMVALFGEPADVMAMTVPVASGADGAGAALLGYPGFVGDVSFSKITGSFRVCEIEGEDGTLLIDRIDRPRELTLRLRDGSVLEESVSSTSAGDAGELDLGASDAAAEGELANMRFEVARFVEIVGGDSGAADLARTRAMLRVTDRIRAAG